MTTKVSERTRSGCFRFLRTHVASSRFPWPSLDTISSNMANSITHKTSDSLAVSPMMLCKGTHVELHRCRNQLAAWGHRVCTSIFPGYRQPLPEVACRKATHVPWHTESMNQILYCLLILPTASNLIGEGCLQWAGFDTFWFYSQTKK